MSYGEGVHNLSAPTPGGAVVRPTDARTYRPTDRTLITIEAAGWRAVTNYGGVGTGIRATKRGGTEREEWMAGQTKKG